MTKSMSCRPPLHDLSVIGTKVARTNYNHAAETIAEWAQSGDSRYVCVACVNNVMEAHDSAEFHRITNEADLVVPDGTPIVWALRLLGNRDATRVYGPDLTPVILERAQAQGLPVGFYGGSPDVLKRLLEVIVARFPTLQVAYAYSPPFRPLTPEEDAREVAAISSSGARILFIGLNTPKQDYWMAAHKGRVQAVMVGVGAAFDFLAGTKPQAPRWMMPCGLEWMFRLATEPRRLWKRYLKHNPRFMIFFGFQLLKEKVFLKS